MATVEAASTYLAIIEEGPESHGAYVPDLPGCVVVGDSREEVEELIRGGIALYLETLRERGDPLPAPTTTAILVGGPAPHPRRTGEAGAAPAMPGEPHAPPGGRR